MCRYCADFTLKGITQYWFDMIPTIEIGYVVADYNSNKYDYLNLD